MRIVQGERVLLWARVWDDFYGIDVVFDHPIASPVIPTTAVEARRFGAWESPDWLSRWAHRFCDQLSGSVTPLHRGDWVLRPLEWPHSHQGPRLRGEPARADWYDDFTGIGRAAIDWDVGMAPPLIPLRPMPTRDDARVRAFVKLVRDHTLPPVLVWWVEGFCSYFVIDGHDRLAAAMVADQQVPILALCSVRDRDEAHGHGRAKRGDPYAQIDTVIAALPDNPAAHNAAARAAFLFEVDSEAVDRTRAWVSTAPVEAWPSFVENEI
jgi:hypothetical protein